jgi:rubrerythrin
MSYALPEFLAHAVALEQEAAERYLELADMMESYRNDPVSALFRDMHRFSVLHRDQIQARVGKVVLPVLKSWEYRWRTPPEVGGEEAFEPGLDAYSALRYARENERRALAYYRAVAEESTDAEVKRLASDFADEEAGHVASLDKWLALTPRPSTTWQADPEVR